MPPPPAKPLVLDITGTVQSGGLFGGTSKLTAVATERAPGVFEIQGVAPAHSRYFPDVWLIITDLAALRAAVASRDIKAIVEAFKKLLADLGVGHMEVRYDAKRSSAAVALTWGQWLQLTMAFAQLVAAVRQRNPEAIIEALQAIAVILGLSIA